jgi:type IV secretion system protein VirB8
MGNLIKPLSEILKSKMEKSEIKPQKSDKIAADRYLKEIKEFESDRNDFKNKLIKIGFGVAGVFAFTTIMAMAAIMFMTPLKDTIPYLLRVDNATGHVDVVKPLSDAKVVTYGEALDKYWLRVYIKNRNSYEWEQIQNNFNIVKLMSGNDVFITYSSYITGEKSPVNTFEDNRIIEITKIDVTFLPTTSKQNRIAQIRFQLDVKTAQGLPVPNFKPVNWTATLTFDYKAEIKTEDERALNPLGFRVTSYREDRVSS